MTENKEKKYPNESILPDIDDLEFLFQNGAAFSAGDVRTIYRIYRDNKTGKHYATDMYGNNPREIDSEELHWFEESKKQYDEAMEAMRSKHSSSRTNDVEEAAEEKETADVQADSFESLPFTERSSLPYEQAVEEKKLSFPDYSEETLFEIKEAETVAADEYAQSVLNRYECLCIDLKTGNLYRCITYSESYVNRRFREADYTIPEDEEYPVSYDELPALIEKSPDKKAKKYKGMTADNWRETIQSLYLKSRAPSFNEIQPGDLLDEPRQITEFYICQMSYSITYFRIENGTAKLFYYDWNNQKNRTVNMAEKFAENGSETVRYIKENAAENEEWFDRTCSGLDVRFILSQLEKKGLYDFPRRVTMPYIEISEEYDSQYQSFQLWYVENGVRYYIDYLDLSEFDNMLNKASWACRPDKIDEEKLLSLTPQNYKEWLKENC